MAKVLHVSVFLNVLDHLAIAELAQSAEDGGGDQEAKGVSCASFLRVVERDEAFHDGLPRDNVAQEDQIMGGVGQMSLDPLGRERVLKCLCYHGMDLCEGCRKMTLRHYLTDQRSQKHALREKISGYYLERCQLTIHMIGAHYGIIPEATNRSIVDLQQAIAAEYSKAHPLFRCLWMPVGLQVTEERQAQFVDYVQY